MRVHPGGNGPVLTAGTLGVTTGVTLLVGCLVAAAPELEADEEFLSEPVDGLESGAGVITGVSEADWPSLLSAGAEPLLEDAEERFRDHREIVIDPQTRTAAMTGSYQKE